MSVSDARKRANQKWDRENMQLVACKVRRETAEAFKAAAYSAGTTPNELLRQYIEAYLSK